MNLSKQHDFVNVEHFKDGLEPHAALVLVRSRFYQHEVVNLTLLSENDFLKIMMMSIEFTSISAAVQLHSHSNVRSPALRVNPEVSRPDKRRYPLCYCVIYVIVSTESL